MFRSVHCCGLRLGGLLNNGHFHPNDPPSLPGIVWLAFPCCRSAHCGVPVPCFSLDGQSAGPDYQSRTSSCLALPVQVWHPGWSASSGVTVADPVVAAGDVIGPRPLVQLNQLYWSVRLRPRSLGLVTGCNSSGAELPMHCDSLVRRPRLCHQLQRPSASDGRWPPAQARAVALELARNGPVVLLAGTGDRGFAYAPPYRCVITRPNAIEMAVANRRAAPSGCWPMSSPPRWQAQWRCPPKDPPRLSVLASGASGADDTVAGRQRVTDFTPRAFLRRPAWIPRAAMPDGLAAVCLSGAFRDGSVA